MKRLHIMALAAVPFAAAFLTTSSAHSEDTRFLDGTLSGHVVMVSDYRSRGVDYSDNDFALQGSINYTHDTGFYVGGWASSIASTDVRGEIEVDLYGGYSGEIEGFSYQFGGILYSYATGDHSQKTDFVDASGTISKDFGFASGLIGVLYAFSMESIGNQDNIFIYTNLDVPVPGTPITLKTHIGYEDGAFGDSKVDGLLGATNCL